MERVSLISPLANASSLFVLPLSLIFLRDVDRLNARKIGAIVLVILGVFLISWEKL
jgi:drug/metabolite transporter (DMT)-like permease